MCPLSVMDESWCSRRDGPGRKKETETRKGRTGMQDAKPEAWDLARSLSTSVQGDGGRGMLHVLAAHVLSYRTTHIVCVSFDRNSFGEACVWGGTGPAIKRPIHWTNCEGMRCLLCSREIGGVHQMYTVLSCPALFILVLAVFFFFLSFPLSHSLVLLA
jgi:hypothetical protein